MLAPRFHSDGSAMHQSFDVVFALYPRITQLDFAGPYEVLWRLPNARCSLGSTVGGAVEADGGLVFQTQRLVDIANCDLLCVPGGFGVVAAMEDAAFLAQLRRLAAVSRYVTSVCTGSLALAAAGLLKGRRAACHWAWRDLLAEFDGVTPDPARVVRDGPIFTGGGVTAGIDMALTLMAEIVGDTQAQAVQLGIEYAPSPPFDAGHPDTAGAEIVAAVRARLQALGSERRLAAQRAAAALARWRE
jgi:cyclohexyl-isocyanide hydratase